MKETEKLDMSQTVSVVSHYMGAPNEKGYWSCIFHDDKTPSLTVEQSKENHGKHYFKCYGCGEFGDAYSLVAQREGLDCSKDFPKVVEKTNSIIGLCSVGSGFKNTERFKNQSKRIPVEMVTVDMVSHVYEELIKFSSLEDAGVINYLNERCLNIDLCIALGFRFIAYADRKKIINHFRNMIPEADLIKSGLFKKEDTGSGLIFLFPNQLLIPWVFNDEVHGIQGRQINDESAKKFGKYKNTPIIPLLYIPPIAMDKNKDLLVTEGAIDAVSHLSFYNGRAVALPSVSVSKEKLALIGDLILKANPPKVVLGTDGDKAGEAKKKGLGDMSIKEFLTKYLIDKGFNRFKIKELVYPDGIKDMNQIIVAANKKRLGLSY